ncbi:MAG: hypothetical protein JXB35_10375, partial [Anaerolineae bacterium]|nr:hypothetical protein [Anaerolineae bacterium]
RERSVLDIGAAFWLGFGKSSGGPVELQVLSEEVALADRWIGYAEPGTLVRTNPAGKPTLFGDIAGTLEGRIAAILLLLKQGRREELMLEVQNAVKAATRSYARGGQYAGHVWRAIWQGAAQRLGPIGRQTRPVRWVLDPVAEHCRQCQEFGADPPGRTYPSWDALLSFTGGILPGFGTDCNGNCRCHVEVENGDVWGWL